VVLAQTSDQQEVDEQIRSAQLLKTIGYVIASAGIVVIMGHSSLKLHRASAIQRRNLKGD
jgi:hypothetical protein